MVHFGGTLLLLSVAHLAHTLSIQAGASDSSEGERADEQTLPNVENPRCEKSEGEIYLKFSNVGLQRINQGFVDSSLVTCVSLDRNEIYEISSEAFTQTPNLRYLDLSGNRLEGFRLFSFGGFKNLRTLVLDDLRSYSGYSAYNSYYNRNREGALIDENLWMISFPQLETLYLRRSNREISMPDFTTSMPNLTSLHLSGNKFGPSRYTLIDSLPHSLTHLSLDNNDLARMSSKRLQNLVYLNLDYNVLEQVCRKYCQSHSFSLDGASNLHYLLLSNNRLTNVHHDAFSDAKSLRYLNLSHNSIEFFGDDTFKPLTNLRDFVANDNHLKLVPDVCDMTSLRKIVLSKNQIQTVQQGAFCLLPELRKILLDGNMISSIDEDAFLNLVSLDYLDLSSNQLNVLPENWVHSLTNLRDLFLMNNTFTDFDHFRLTNVKSLTDLHVEDNPITRLNTRAFTQLPTNISVHFQSFQGCQRYRPIEWLLNKNLI